MTFLVKAQQLKYEEPISLWIFLNLSSGREQSYRFFRHSKATRIWWRV